MTQRRPIVLISGNFSELPTGDSTYGSSVNLVANPSGLYLAGSDLGFEGGAIDATARSSAASAQASGNAALVDLSNLTILGEDDVISLIVGLS
jgi:hypothetical protein